MNNPHYTIILYRDEHYDYQRSIAHSSKFELQETDDKNDAIKIIAEAYKENHFAERTCPEIEIRLLIDGHTGDAGGLSDDVFDMYDNIRLEICDEARILSKELINKKIRIDEAVRTFYEEKRKEAERLEDLRKLEALKAKLGLNE